MNTETRLFDVTMQFYFVALLDFVFPLCGRLLEMIWKMNCARNVEMNSRSEELEEVRPTSRGA